MMAEQRERSPFRFLWRLTLIGALIVVVILGLGLGYLYSLPRPDRAVLAEAERKYEQVRALYPKLATPAPVSTQTPQPKNQTQTTTESLQARCDRLFKELLLPTEIMTALDTRELDAKLENARELAAMYDSGIRVSDEARNLYRLVHADAFRYIAQSLAEGRHPGDPKALQYGTTWTAREQDPVVRAKLFDNLVTALKFLRVADCPFQHLYIYQELIVALQPPPINASGPLRALPSELMTLDLNLLAPRRALDWPRCMALALEQCREQRKYWENMLDTGFVFDRLCEMESRARVREPWSSKAFGYCRSVAGALVISRKHAPATLDYFRSVETNFEDYATSCAKSVAPIPADNTMIQLDFDQLQARLIAGALALRRGEPVPPLDKIGPDSYFFDPVMQRPYILRASNTGRETGLLEVLRPFRFSNGVVQKMTRMNIALPANHPGLEKIQRTP